MNQTPGYYWAEGDPPGTTRYWDGIAWQGGPTGGPGIPSGLRTQFYPQESQAMTAFVVALLSLVLCQLLGPVAWYLGDKEIKAIDSGLRDPSRRDFAKASKIIGIVMTVLLVAMVAFFVFFLLIAALGSTA